MVESTITTSDIAEFRQAIDEVSNRLGRSSHMVEIDLAPMYTGARQNGKSHQEALALVSGYSGQSYADL